jgi:hypothetical protein
MLIIKHKYILNYKIHYIEFELFRIIYLHFFFN